MRAIPAADTGLDALNPLAPPKPAASPIAPALTAKPAPAAPPASPLSALPGPDSPAIPTPTAEAAPLPVTAPVSAPVSAPPMVNTAPPPINSGVPRFLGGDPGPSVSNPGDAGQAPAPFDPNNFAAPTGPGSRMQLPALPQPSASGGQAPTPGATPGTIQTLSGDWTPPTSAPTSAPLIKTTAGGTMTPQGDAANSFRGYQSSEGGSFGSTTAQTAGVTTWEQLAGQVHASPQDAARMQQEAAAVGVTDPRVGYALSSLSSITGQTPQQMFPGGAQGQTPESLKATERQMGLIANADHDAIKAGLASSDPMIQKAAQAKAAFYPDLVPKTAAQTKEKLTNDVLAATFVPGVGSARTEGNGNIVNPATGEVLGNLNDPNLDMAALKAKMGATGDNSMNANGQVVPTSQMPATAAPVNPNAGNWTAKDPAEQARLLASKATAADVGQAPKPQVGAPAPSATSGELTNPADIAKYAAARQKADSDRLMAEEAARRAASQAAPLAVNPPPIAPPTPTPSPLPSAPDAAAGQVASRVTPPMVNNAPILANPTSPEPSVTNPSDVGQVGGASGGAPMPVGPASPAGSVSTTPYTADQNLIDQTISRAPTADRFKIAQDKYDASVAAGEPQYEADQRSAMRKAAAGGALGSGMLNTSLGDIVSNRDTANRTNRTNFLNDALTGTISDSFGDTNIAQQQQGFQKGVSDTAFGQEATTTQLQDQLQNSSFGRALQALLAGSSGNPADTSLILSQIFGDQAGAASSALGGLISGTTTNNATAGSGNQLEDIIRKILESYGGGTSASDSPSSDNPTN